MSRLRRIELAGRYFVVTTNLIRHSQSLTPSEREICLDQIGRSRAKHKFALFAYVVMPDHIHLLLWTMESLLPKLMRVWKSGSGFAIAKLRSKQGPIWQERYFDFILRRAGDFGKKLEYIHANPVEAGLVVRPEDWKWSSAAFYIKKEHVPIRPDVFAVPSDPNEPLWPVPWR
jgi:REP element-mobilizing transposase RayT